MRGGLACAPARHALAPRAGSSRSHICIHQSIRSVRCRGARLDEHERLKDEGSASAAAYEAALAEVEMDEDFVKALELLAEARLLKLELSSASIECAVRTCAASDQWERALGLFEGLLQRGATPSTATTVAVLEAVGAEKNEELTDRALALVSGPGSSRQGDVEVSNVTARVLAQSGRALAAYDLVEAMVTKQQFVQERTYYVLALQLSKIGESDKAEEVLEWRDYLTPE